MSLAKSSRTLLSQDVVDQLATHSIEPAKLFRVGEFTLKGFGDPTNIYELKIPHLKEDSSASNLGSVHSEEKLKRAISAKENFDEKIEQINED